MTSTLSCKYFVYFFRRFFGAYLEEYPSQQWNGSRRIHRVFIKRWCLCHSYRLVACSDVTCFNQPLLWVRVVELSLAGTGIKGRWSMGELSWDWIVRFGLGWSGFECIGLWVWLGWKEMGGVVRKWNTPTGDGGGWVTMLIIK